MRKKVKLSESKLKNIISRIIKEEFSDATTFNKSLWTIVPNAALGEIKSNGGLFPYNGDTSVATKGVYLCNDKNAIQAYRSPNSSYVEVDFGKLMSSLKGTRNANIQKRDFNGAITYIVPYVPSDCISSVEPCGRGGQLQEEKHLNKLTESDLHKIVKESVNKVLNEDSGIDAQERIYHTIANLENDLKTVISNTDSSSNQAFGSPDEKLSMISNGLSHIDMNLSKQAETTFSKLLEVMSELQNLRINLKTLGAKDSYWGHNFQRETPHGTVGLSNYH